MCCVCFYSLIRHKFIPILFTSSIRRLGQSDIATSLCAVLPHNMKSLSFDGVVINALHSWCIRVEHTAIDGFVRVMKKKCRTLLFARENGSTSLHIHRFWRYAHHFTMQLICWRMHRLALIIRSIEPKLRYYTNSCSSRSIERLENTNEKLEPQKEARTPQPD